MKKSLLLALLALSLSAASSSLATAAEWVGGIQGGVHIPSSDYGDRAKGGFVGGVFADYIWNDMFTLGAQFDFNSTKAKDDDSVKLSILNYGAHGNLYFMKEGVVRPYVAATVGAYTSKIKVDGGNASPETDPRTVMGFGGGLGVHIQPAGNPIGFGVEAMYHTVGEAFSKGSIDANFINVVGKVTFSFSDKTQMHQ